ncbi:MAG: hypothetical protein K8R59_09685 [Thermoanaerobaculales bacterium]|nr:hypothetical protein [Thermoanaerobaculales bacterium]
MRAKFETDLPLPAMAALAVVHLFVYGFRPVVAQPWQWADDRLYAGAAQNIILWIAGQQETWLGAYDYLTLAKAPMFPIWLSVVSLSGLPLRLAEALLILLAGYVILRGIGPILPKNKGFLTLAFFLLTFLPIFGGDSRILRTWLNVSLTGIALGSLYGLQVRVLLGRPRVWRWAILTGLATAAFSLNREESSWFLLWAVIGLLIVVLTLARTAPPLRSAGIAGAAIVSFLIPVLTVCFLNYSSYGVFVTTARKSPHFEALYQNLVALDPRPRIRYVPARTETRKIAYELSPTFAILKPYLDPPPMNHFLGDKVHNRINGMPPETREYFVSNFEWALRKSAFISGAAPNAPDAEAFFRRAAQELESAMRSGLVTSSGRGFSILPPVTREDIPRLITSFAVGLRNATLLRGVPTQTAQATSGSPSAVFGVSQLTNSTTTPPKKIQLHPANQMREAIRTRAHVILLRTLPPTYLALIFTGFLSLPWILRSAFVESHLRISLTIAVQLLGTVFTSVVPIALVHTIGWPVFRWGGAPYLSATHMLIPLVAVISMSFVWPMIGELGAAFLPSRPKGARRV